MFSLFLTPYNYFIRYESTSIFTTVHHKSDVILISDEMNFGIHLQRNENVDKIADRMLHIIDPYIEVPVEIYSRIYRLHILSENT